VRRHLVCEKENTEGSVMTKVDNAANRVHQEKST
jgi:hypothetical protein